MTENRKPKYVLDEFDGREGPDAFFAAVIRRMNEEHAQVEELANRKPEPPPEEAKPTRRRSHLLEQRPRWSGQRKPDPEPRDANT
jgi:hypothetical protein